MLENKYLFNAIKKEESLYPYIICLIKQMTPNYNYKAIQYLQRITNLDNLLQFVFTFHDILKTIIDQMEYYRALKQD